MFRMPVTACKHRQMAVRKLFNVAIQHRYHLITLGYRQTTAGQEIILNVDKQQGIAGSQGDFFSWFLFSFHSLVCLKKGMWLHFLAIIATIKTPYLDKPFISQHIASGHIRRC